MGTYDFSTAASTASGNLSQAIGSVLTASLLSQYGTESMGGIATAMTGYSFSGAASSVGSGVRSAVSSN